ncbi:SpoIIAA family protein [Microbulbifer thermotolerans]|uniref:STAS/SEC14 domain-containing protein n=1 Tax=Microbulbifer thermotolerans TaxID=252514 RepID=A0AB35HYR8_MICTH|nr:STAS/SEC14 domain-containing protein [Microbulbifer thermotolerans]MCX2780360.1 STAS/SEC14 domain-containing protein [Microbulbifer thermotolerans]MCX2802193.1 STAS/SEC14 domain-containing protein [Microbulbifer thermotolerans]MCX2805968.1 STAS/SEC14 domain-containing protein [Microbulbifer thermotolerans]MCX2832629.1 STAS/SEC14 domain-containing protein [Microbulbifer thermotolerans]MCX2836257.1 STAS/SEC14 domain-containing protein [Microbulbifer thermotolerans]
MFDVKRVADNRLDIIFSGKLDAEEMKRALNVLVEQSDGIENGTMLFDVIEYYLPSLEAIGIELARLPEMLRFIRKFNKAAVLTDQNWIAKISELEGALIPGLHIKAFTRAQRAEAEAWLNATTA